MQQWHTKTVDLIAITKKSHSNEKITSFSNTATSNQNECKKTVNELTELQIGAIYNGKQQDKVGKASLLSDRRRDHRRCHQAQSSSLILSHSIHLAPEKFPRSPFSSQQSVYVIQSISIPTLLFPQILMMMILYMIIIYILISI